MSDAGGASLIGGVPGARGVGAVAGAGMWGASIALSWLWGLGLFFSIHFTVLHGLAGLLLFALPNAAGLLLFGLLAGRRARTGDLRSLAEGAFARHPHVFALYQLAAVALTLFAFVRYYLQPLGVPAPLLVGFFVLLLASVAAARLGLARLVAVHAALLPLVAGALLALPFLLPGEGVGPGGLAGADGAFLAMGVPVVLGLLLGPWFDLQQWQRAVAVAEAGLSVERAFAVGAGLFLALLLGLGALALSLPAGLATASAGTPLDPWPFAGEAAVAAMTAAGEGAAAILFSLVVVVAVFSTFDSSRLAVGWFMARTVAASDHFLLSLVPARLRTATLPFLLACLALAGAGVAAGVELPWYMIFFGSASIAFSAVFAAEMLAGRRLGADGEVFAIALASACLLAAGYLGGHGALVAAGPLVALLALPVAAAAAPPAGRPGGTDRPQGLVSPDDASAPARVADGRPLASVDTASAGPLATPPGGGTVPAVPVLSAEGRFEGKWFQLPIVTTYADTNSVGNVYFANYVGWVGKTRELFFRHCMPGFDIRGTRFLILTRAFQHKFLRETREFDQLVCRLRIGTFNRKFVELQHEIRDREDRLIGKGSQTLMFVDATDYRLIDIPKDVVTAFEPHV